MKRLRIRPAATADAAQIARVHVEASRAAYRGIVSDDHLDRMSVAQREAMWREFLPRVETRLLVAETDAAGVVGFAAGGPSRWAGMPFDAEMYAFYLAPEADAAGATLVRELAGRLRAAGHAAMMAWALARDPVCRFYEKMGGELVGARVDDVGGTFLEERAYGWRDLAALSG